MHPRCRSKSASRAPLGRRGAGAVASRIEPQGVPDSPQFHTPGECHQRPESGRPAPRFAGAAAGCRAQRTPHVRSGSFPASRTASSILTQVYWSHHARMGTSMRAPPLGPRYAATCLKKTPAAFRRQDRRHQLAPRCAGRPRRIQIWPLPIRVNAPVRHRLQTPPPAEARRTRSADPRRFRRHAH